MSLVQFKCVNFLNNIPFCQINYFLKSKSRLSFDRIKRSQMNQLNKTKLSRVKDALGSTKYIINI